MPVLPSTRSTTTTQPTTTRRVDVRALLLEDPSATIDPALPSRLRMVRENLARLELLAVADTGRTAPLRPERVASLGEQAQARAVSVTTRVAGETRGVTHVLWVTLDADGRLVSLGDTAERDPEPLWSLEPITVTRRGAAVVIATAGHDPASWLDGLERAATELRAAGLAPGVLVAEIPRNSLQLSRMVAGDSLRSAGAASWPFGEGDRILVNPGPGAATTGEARQFLLTHESVHAVTGSGHRSWPRWWIEGYADQVAATAHPAVEAELDRQLRAALQAGAPARLPADEELDPTRPDATVGYARARVGVRVLGPAAKRVQDKLGAGAALDDALRDNGWTRETLSAATAEALARLKE
ncbi:hypothetical protein [Mariniluteicoccus endophyticus]